MKDTDRDQPQYQKTGVFVCYIDHNKYHMDWPGIKVRSLR